ncbi:hypothetical protein [Caloramator sp. Dgby_cultured_2]|uniref:hypothetical protein n=1 Tax=Caloramator sp. Dgby_cultured_2 TaxID=3029174 RepID=UPI00237D4344|nr:hypothetical protein [Caloramator sp. Dgby_cultured_2]WDU84236.1 hypothetical protein PWK10_07940 [Caloramator sp. Dgby_cultured_2]
MSFKIKGLNEFRKNLKKIEDNLKEFEKTNTVSFNELFNSQFMNKYTNFSSFEEFLSYGGFIVNSQEDFEAIPDDKMNELVQKTTIFSSWEEMLSKATETYLAKKLGF